MATSTIKSNASEWKQVNTYLNYKEAGGNVTAFASSSGGLTLAANAWTNIGNLPIGFRPTIEITFPIALRGTTQSDIGKIGTDGILSLHNGTSIAQSYWGYCVTFPL